jgi:SAM-dependent methyltransferase
MNLVKQLSAELSMMPLVEFASESVLCHIDQVTSIPKWFADPRRQGRFGDIVAFDITDDSAALTHLRPLADDDLPRIMDHFYLWTPRGAPQGRQILLDALFEILADTFDQVVHREQNLNNIHVLCGLIKNHFGVLEQKRILDFGCGPGLAVEVSRVIGADVVGYDRCIHMRSAAINNGLQVLTPEQFISISSGTFDAAFASYVFHLGPSGEDLRRLWQLIRPGGIIVANFHKQHNLVEITDCFRNLGARARELRVPPLQFHHGTYWEYVRCE